MAFQQSMENGLQRQGEIHELIWIERFSDGWIMGVLQIDMAIGDHLVGRGLILQLELAQIVVFPMIAQRKTITAQ